MFRIQSSLKSRNVPQTLWRWQARRHQSTHQRGGGPNKLLIAAAGTTSLLAGVVGYGSYSTENRKAIEDLIPGSNYVFESILGPSFHDVVIPETKPKPLKIPKGLQGGDEVEVKEEVKEIEPLVSEEPVAIEEPIVIEEPLAVPAPPIEEISAPVEEEIAPVETDITPTEEIASTEEDSSPKELIIIVPSAEERENTKLSELLQDLKDQTSKCIGDALNSAENAAQAIQAHAETAFKAIDSADEKLFASVSEVADSKAELIQLAEEKIEAAVGMIEKLNETVASSLESAITKGNKELVAAEEAIADFHYTLKNIKTIITQANNDSKAVAEYGELVDAGRKQFAAEVRSLTPDVKLGETSEKLTTEELNLLLAHAHRKVINLQRLLAKHQVLEHDSFKQAIEQQRKEELNLLESKIQAELDKQEQLLNLQFKQQVSTLNEEFEDELRSQLKRQAAAHSDHLSEVLSVQEKELESKWLLRLQEEVQTERDQYHREVADMRGQVEGLNTALTLRADIDRQAYAARELWLACESLKSALKQKNTEESLISLTQHINAIIKASGPDNKFVKVVLNALPEEVSSRGVYSEAALRERFQRVDRVAKKVAIIGDNGGSLIKYLLSYIQNILIINAFETLPLDEKNDEEVEVDNFTTHDILARARYCLDKDDLLQAIKYMNLLRGEPRHVSSDWMKEARLILETRLIADTLLAHAAATATTAL